MQEKASYRDEGHYSIFVKYSFDIFMDKIWAICR